MRARDDLQSMYVPPLVTYDENMSLTDPEALFQQKIPQVYLQLQDSIRTVVVNMKTNDKPPVMRSNEFR